jgi:predicted ester cyclase
MSTEENKALVRRYYDEVVNQHKLEVLDEIMGTAEDGAREDFRDFHRGFQTQLQSAFPDVHETVEQLIAEDDWVAVRIRVEGTHTGGEYTGIPATGKHLQISVAAIWRIRRGKLVSNWATWNRFSVYEQLGVLSLADLQRETNKAVIRRWIEARNAMDVEAAMQCWAEGRNSIRNSFLSFNQAFPDIRVTIDELIAEGDKVLMRATMRGTHLGAWLEIPPSGKAIEWQLADTYMVKDGKIQTLVRVAPDLKAMLRNASATAAD